MAVIAEMVDEAAVIACVQQPGLGSPVLHFNKVINDDVLIIPSGRVKNAKQSRLLLP